MIGIGIKPGKSNGKTGVDLSFISFAKASPRMAESFQMLKKIKRATSGRTGYDRLFEDQ